ncbi:MAG: DUF1254 domain-containing protein [Hyphomicrobiales bacterium]|nr:DUF1254 domain-containing protein [Hyphomicrobiales bacterium]
MTGRTFWVISFVLLVVASHLAYVLFGTRLDSQALFQDLAAVTGTNKLRALSGLQARQLSSTSDGKLVHAVCAFDLSQGPIKLTAKFPDNYWSVNIYSLQGDVIYTLNDRQANIASLSIVIRTAAGGVEEDSQAVPAPVGSKDIQVVANTTRGLAVLRSSFVHEKQRKRVADTLNSSECGRVKS